MLFTDPVLTTIDNDLAVAVCAPPLGVDHLYRKIGTRIRLRRAVLGLSQEQLAHRVGITYHRANMYESGLLRLSGACLVEFAKALSVPVSWFFEDAVGRAAPDAVTPTVTQRSSFPRSGRSAAQPG